MVNDEEYKEALRIYFVDFNIKTCQPRHGQAKSEQDSEAHCAMEKVGPDYVVPVFDGIAQDKG